MRFAVGRTFAVAVACALATAAPAAAQASGGLKGGLLLADLAYTSSDADVEAALSLTPRPDITFGGFVVAQSAAPVSAQIEAMYSRRGANLMFPEDREASSHFVFTYLDVSGLIRARAATTRTGEFYVIGGPTVGFSLATEQITLGEVVDEETEFVKKLDFRLTLGAGATVQRLVIEGRYTFGLVNISDSETVLTTVKNRALEALIGFRF